MLTVAMTNTRNCEVCKGEAIYYDPEHDGITGEWHMIDRSAGTVVAMEIATGEFICADCWCEREGK